MDLLSENEADALRTHVIMYGITERQADAIKAMITNPHSTISDRVRLLTLPALVASRHDDFAVGKRDEIGKTLADMVAEILEYEHRR